jgi:hypothetical protein
MWKRLNEKRLKNLGGETGNRRAYGKDGKLWPRIVLVVAPCLAHDDQKTFRVSCIIKESQRHWWTSSYIPEELRPELIELLGEHMGDSPDE